MTFHRSRGHSPRAAYRILQEGTTNALRHGDSGPIEITVAVGSESVELRVVNSIGAVTGGKGRRSSKIRRGLAGLAERVRLLNVSSRLDRTEPRAGD